MKTMSQEKIKAIILFLLTPFIYTPLHAQKTKTGMIWGELLDNFTLHARIADRRKGYASYGG